MKTIKYSIILTLLIGVSMMMHSCSKNAEPRFLVDIERDFDVETTLNPVITHFFELKNIETRLDQSLDLFNLPKDEIAGISPSDAILTTASGLMDWSLVNSVEIWAISRVNPTNKHQIFFIRGRDPGNSNELKLFNTFADLSEIMLEETIDLEIRLTTITSITGNFRARLLFNYAVFDEI